MKKTSLILAIVLFFLVVNIAPATMVQAEGAPVLADAYGLEDAAGTAGLKNETSFPQTIGTILFIAISLIGVIFLVLTVYGGFLWMTAGGNNEKTKKAGAIIRNGAIGVLIVLSAYAITQFIVIDLLVGSGNS